MTDTSTIPEMLGFAAIPFERDEAYSAGSYQAMYLLTPDEAEGVIKTYHSHPAIELHLAQRFIKDPEYRGRINEARKNITGSEPDEETRRAMRRLISKMSPPTTGAREAVERIIGELPEDRDGAA